MKWSMEQSIHNGKRMILTTMLVTLLRPGLTGCALFPKEAEEEVLPDIQAPKLSKKPVYPVGTATLELKVSGGGKVMSMNERSLFFTEEGKRLKEIYVASGDLVKKGQLLAELDTFLTGLAAKEEKATSGKKYGVGIYFFEDKNDEIKSKSESNSSNRIEGNKSTAPQEIDVLAMPGRKI